MDSAGARQQRPAASTVSSASQSSSSLSTLASSSAFPIPGQTSHQAPAGPLRTSSPVQQGQFFGSLHPDTMSAQSTQTQLPQQQAPTSNSWDYQPNRNGAGQTAQETMSYLNEYNLVAEAAKRAQMAVLMRDMEGVELS